MLLTAQTHKSKCFYNNFDATQYRYRNEHGEKSTLQVDVLASFWKSVNVTREFYTFTPEYRYHFKEKYFMQVHTLQVFIIFKNGTI
jgi:hypothetical protein